MLTRLCALSFVAALAATTAACSTGEKSADDGASTSQDLHDYDLDVTVLGTITPGQTKANVAYAPPNRDAFSFTAHEGQVITITVSSHAGDAVAYLTDSHLGILAYNDDADASTHNARIVYQAPATASYDIVFEDYNHLPASFDVSLATETGSVCKYAGNTYAEGDTFPASDGCNTCTCNANGGITCGSNVCACNPSTDVGLTYYGGPDWCKVNQYHCPSGQVRFSNDCGCGCEILTTTHRPKSSP